MISLIIQSIYLALPGIFANMAPVLFKRLKWLAIPIDMGAQWNDKPVFGKNKTYRGLIVGVLSAIVIMALQTWLYGFEYFRSISLIPYGDINFLLLGFLMGFGVMAGDLIESAIKRRLNKKPGERFFPWDQLDHLVGGLIFVSIVYVPPWQIMLTLLLLAVLLHIIIKNIGFYLGMEDTRW